MGPPPTFLIVVALAILVVPALPGPMGHTTGRPAGSVTPLAGREAGPSAGCSGAAMRGSCTVRPGIVSARPNGPFSVTALTWSNLTAGSVSTPGPRSSPTVAYDPLLNESILFGGYLDSGPTAYGDTWAFSGGNWTDLTSSLTNAPSARWAASTAFDPALGGIVLFGGRDASGFYNDTWLFNATGWWQIAKAGGPSPRGTPSMAYDPVDGELLLFSGFDLFVSQEVTNDTWALTRSGWTQLAPYHGVAPPAGDYSEGTWDGSDGYFLVLGGNANPTGRCGTEGYTWTYVGGNWTNRTVSTAPEFPGGSLSLQYDPDNGTTFLYAGSYSGANSCNQPPSGSTWEYVKGTWTNRTASLSPAPQPRCCAGFTYDAEVGGLLLFGGNGNINPYQTGRLADTLALLAPPLVSLVANRTRADVGIPVRLTAAASPSLPTPIWNWSFGDGSGAADGTAQEVHEFSTPGTYAVNLSADDGTIGRWHRTVSVRVQDLPNVSLTAIPTTADAPASVQFWANASGGFAPYAAWWNLSGGSSIRGLRGTIDVGSSGQYQLNATFEDQGGLVQNATWTLDVNPTPHATILFQGTRTIAPGRVTGSAAIGGGTTPWTGRWDFAGAVVPGLVANHTFASAGDYPVLFSANDSLGTNVHEEFVAQVLPAIVVTPEASPPIGAAGFTTVLSASAMGGGGTFTYNWTLPVGTPSTTAPSVSLRFPQAGVYNATVVATDQYGFASAPATVQVTVVAPLTLALAGARPFEFAPFSAALSANTTGGAFPVAFQWDFGDGSAVATSTGTANHTYAGLGLYTVKVSARDAIGEVALAAATFRLILPLRAQLAAAPNATTTGVPVNLTAARIDGFGPFTYTWSGLPEGCALADAAGGACVFAAPGRYAIEVVISDAASESAMASVNLTIVPAASGGPSSDVGSLELGGGLAFLAVVAVAVVAALVLRRRRPPTEAGPPSPSEALPEDGSPLIDPSADPPP